LRINANIEKHLNYFCGMITGNGLVAHAFKKYSQDTGILIFASGVSDSKNSTTEQFEREKSLLLQTLTENKARKFIYFGTTSVNDPDLQQSDYVTHKLKMEFLVQQNSTNYCVFRLPNLAGFSKNPNTVLNFLFNHIIADRPFELWQNSERNIIDIEDVFTIVHYIIRQKLFTNKIVNIANTNNYKVSYIVKCIEDFCGRKALYTNAKKGNTFNISLADVAAVYAFLNITFDEKYLPRILEKYYRKDDL